MDLMVADHLDALLRVEADQQMALRPIWRRPERRRGQRGRPSLSEHSHSSGAAGAGTPEVDMARTWKPTMDSGALCLCGAKLPLVCRTIRRLQKMGQSIRVLAHGLHRIDREVPFAGSRGNSQKDSLRFAAAFLGSNQIF